MELFQNDIQMVGKHKNHKPTKVKHKSLNGYDAIGEKPDENNTWTIKQLVVNEKQKQKSVLV